MSLKTGERAAEIRKPVRKKKRWSREDTELALLGFPTFIWYILFCYLPMFGIIIAFKNYKFKLGILGSKWVGLSNFRRLLESYWFPIILRNTLTLSGLSLLIGFPVPIILALMVNEVQRRRPSGCFRRCHTRLTSYPRWWCAA